MRGCEFPCTPALSPAFGGEGKGEGAIHLFLGCVSAALGSLWLNNFDFDNSSPNKS
jgi:hypothetical protein